MSYEIDIDLQEQDDIAALPATALSALAETITVLELTRGTAAHPSQAESAHNVIASSHASTALYYT